MSRSLLRRPLAAGFLLTLAATGVATSAQATTPVDGACEDASGVTVVVDFTDLGGEVEVGCATDAATGTEALTSAGFVDTRDDASMICAIDAQPDPCPAEFTGSYWAYWHAEPGGEWESYMEGSDTAVPAAGSVEGWRYNDGSAAPSIAPPAATAGSTGGDEGAEQDESASADGTDTSAAEEPSTAEDATSSAWPVVAGVAVLLAAAAVLVARRRRSDFGPAGQD